MDNKIEYKKIFAGNSIFTIVSKKTGNRFTYKIYKKNDNLWFCYLMTGCDNESHYSYIGYYKNNNFQWSVRCNILPTSPSILALNYLLTYKELSLVDIFHCGRCCKCGKLLTTPESIEKGIGPKCESKI